MLIAPPEIPTSSGRLRRVAKDDIAAFSEMNADPRVMEFFPRPWSLEESHAVLERIEREFTERGFGIYAVEFERDALLTTGKISGARVSRCATG